MRAYLIPMHDSRKSFYNKAVVEMKKDSLELYSYNTLVAKIKNSKLEVYNLQSPTTLRHVKEFMQQNGFPLMTKSEISEKYFK